MKPTAGNIFVERAQKEKGKYEVVGGLDDRYEVTKVAKNITTCKSGDFVLIKDLRAYKVQGDFICVVRQDDIVAVEAKK